MSGDEPPSTTYQRSRVKEACKCSVARVSDEHLNLYSSLCSCIEDNEIGA
jgi:hypothetical protein